MNRSRLLIALAVIWLLGQGAGGRAEQSVGVFIALCDNQSQGIAPVPARIGNGLDPEENLYWGCTEGFAAVFSQSKQWRLTRRSDSGTTAIVLRERHYQHHERAVMLYAFAYRGDCIRQCLVDFEQAVLLRKYDLIVYIGHNGLMDFKLPLPLKSLPGAVPMAARGIPDCMVLCCKSDEYFRERIRQLGGTPVLLTTQFMYPGAFILSAALDAWLTKNDGRALRNAAAQAYARNQGISLRAARGVFIAGDAQ